MVEADFNLSPLHIFIIDIYKVFEPLVCCLNGIWVPLHTIPPAKLAPDVGSSVFLRSEYDDITSCLRLISTSDHFLHNEEQHWW